MGDEVILLDFWASPFGMRARIGLAEKGVKYEYRDEDLANKGEFLLKMNPVHKKIPVLVHNNNPVCESRIIVEYIDEVWSNNPLLPSDPYQRAQARFWADFADNKFWESANIIWRTSKGAEKEQAKKDFIERLTILEQQLGDKPYFGGDTFGFIDIAIIPFYSWFYIFEAAGDFKFQDSFPKIIEWVNRCMQRESVAKTLPDQQKCYEFFLVLKKRYGIQ